MGELISELQIELKELALLRQKECNDDYYCKNTDKLIRAFDWNKTIENFDFWDNIHAGKDMANHPNYPKKLSIDDLLEKAKKDYPIGTKVACLKGYSSKDTILKETGIITREAKVYPGDHVWAKGSFYELCLYDNGKWAEIISKPEVKEELELIVNKWYKFNWIWDNNTLYYGKYKKTDNKTIHFKEFFRLDGSCKQEDPAVNISESNNFTLLTDLSEIQQYLPDGHIDKLVVNNYKPIDEQGFKLKYYKFTSPDNGISFTKNRIYKLVEGKTINDECAFIDNRGLKNGWYPNNKMNFIESTKDEYDKQELSNITKSDLLKEEQDNSWFSRPKLPPLKYSDLKPGDYFVDQTDINGTEFINKFVSDNLSYYITKSGRFKEVAGKFCYFYNGLLRLADFSERLWLDKCIEAGKFIPKEEALNPKSLTGDAIVSTTSGFLNLKSFDTGSVNIYETTESANEGARTFNDIWNEVPIRVVLPEFSNEGKNLLKEMIKYNKDYLEFQTPVIIKSKNARKNKLIIIN